MKPQPFFLLNKQTGWQAQSLDSIELADGGCALQLAPLPGAVTPVVDAAGTLGGFVNPVRVAVDRWQRIYILDAATCLIKRFDPCAARFEALPCVGTQGMQPRQFSNPRGLAISPRNDFYVADTGNARVQIFSIKGLALRLVLETPATVKAWEPSDVAVAANCRAYVADALNGLIHVYDAAGCWRSSFNGTGPATPALVKPIRIALDSAGRLYVVQQGASGVVVLKADGTYLTTITDPDSLSGRFCPAAIAVDAQGILHIADRFAPLVQQIEGDTWRRKCQFHAAGTNSGSITDLTFDSAGTIIALSGKQVVQMNTAAVFDTDGVFTTNALDSRIYHCPWHRVTMRCNIPAGTQITVETLTAEAAKSSTEVALLPDSDWTVSATNSTVGEAEWDCLVQSLPGRYLWLRLAFHGDGHVTPCIDQLKIYFPRASSLQYLPSVYSQDDASRQFLDQFLSIFDTIWGRIGRRIDLVPALFDAMATPAQRKTLGDTDFLSWLASWLGLTLDRHWSLHSRRLLVKNAWKLFQLRGTPAGLKLYLKIYTGVDPHILEHFKMRRWLLLNGVRLGDSSALWGAEIVNRMQLDVHAQVGLVQLIDTGDPQTDPFSKDAFQFTVFLPLTGKAARNPAQAALQQQTVTQIIAMASPAYTQGNLKMTRSLFRVGVQAYVGMDTVVAAYPEQAIEGQSKLGRDSVLTAPRGEEGPPEIRVGRSSRIGSAARIN